MKPTTTTTTTTINNNNISSVPIFYNIKDLLQSDDKDIIEEEFTCSICMEFSNISTQWYQCSKNGHHACGSCWNNILKGSGQKGCMICRSPIKSINDGLSRCIFIEDSFANKKISCPYLFDEKMSFNIDDSGCKDIIRIKDLEQHQKNCESRFVKCINSGCNKIIRFKDISKHQDECEFVKLECEFCSISLIRSSLKNHQKSCTNTMKCNKCSKYVKKGTIQDHKTNDCLDWYVSCTYKDYGCNSGTMKRSELIKHLESVDHSKYLLKVIDQQSIIIANQTQQINELKTKVNNQIEEELKKHEEKMESIKSKLDKLEISKSSDKYSNRWEISEFKEQIAQDIPIRSPTFRFQSYCFYMTIEEESETDETDDYAFSLFAPNVEEDESIIVDFSISIFNRKHKNLYQQSNFRLDTDSRGAFYFKQHLFSKRSGNIQNNNLLIIDFSIVVNKKPLYTSLPRYGVDFGFSSD